MDKINDNFNSTWFLNISFEHKKLYTIKKHIINFNNENEIYNIVENPYFDYYGEFYERKIFNDSLVYGFKNYVDEGIITYFNEDFFSNKSKLDFNKIKILKMYNNTFNYLPIIKYYKIEEDKIPGHIQNIKRKNDIYKIEEYF